MKRRALFMRLAAITAAVALAPAARAEAAPVGQLTPAACPQCGEIGATELIRKTHQMYEHAIADARAEGYERGRAIRDASAESKALRVMRAHNDRAMTPQQLAELVQGMVKTFQDGGIIA